MKNYIGISRDHSASMTSIARAAAKDYNENIASIKEAAHENVIDSIVYVVENGRGRPAAVRRDVVNSNVMTLQPIPETSYITDGNATPLFDSVGDLIEQLEAVPDYKDPEVSFLVMVITDGGENASKKWSALRLTNKIYELQRTDRWSFVFRVPKGHGRQLAQMGIPAGNILEWDGQSAKSVETSTVATRSAVSNYYTERKAGRKSTTTFYGADLTNVSVDQVRAALVPVKGDIKVFPVTMKFHDMDISDFMWNMTGYDMVKGTAFYQLTKTEKDVQSYKKIIIRDRTSRELYSGDNARNLLGLPKHGDVRLVPGKTGNYDVFIQSTSLNRKVKHSTEVLYWSTATIEK